MNSTHKSKYWSVQRTLSIITAIISNISYKFKIQKQKKKEILYLISLKRKIEYIQL